MSLKEKIKSKSFIIAIIAYVLVICSTLAVIFVNFPRRTFGTYIFEYNNETYCEISLTKAKDATFTLSKNIDPSLADEQYCNSVVYWEIAYKELNPKTDYLDLEFKSNEIVVFLNSDKSSYFQYFKVGDKLYSMYNMDEEHGGKQKCFQKL